MEYCIVVRHKRRYPEVDPLPAKRAGDQSLHTGVTSYKGNTPRSGIFGSC